MTNVHQKFLEEAIQLAKESMVDGRGGPFGACIVKGKNIIARGQNCVVRSVDATAHAEVNAIRDACKALGTHVLHGCTIYSSCEPCPMCLSAIYWARIDRVFYAATKDDAASAGFDDSLFHFEVLSSESESKRIRIEQLPTPNAVSVLVDWALKKDKVPY